MFLFWPFSFPYWLHQLVLSFNLSCRHTSGPIDWTPGRIITICFQNTFYDDIVMIDNIDWYQVNIIDWSSNVVSTATWIYFVQCTKSHYKSSNLENIVKNILNNSFPQNKAFSILAVLVKVVGCKGNKINLATFCCWKILDIIFLFSHVFLVGLTLNN